MSSVTSASLSTFRSALLSALAVYCAWFCVNIQGPMLLSLLATDYNLHPAFVSTTMVRSSQMQSQTPRATSLTSPTATIMTSTGKEEDKLRTQKESVHSSIRASSPTLYIQPSPYEQRSGLLRPTWATKLPSYSVRIPSLDQQVCLVHVGKAAGSTVACALGFNYSCPGLAMATTAAEKMNIRESTMNEEAGNHQDDLSSLSSSSSSPSSLMMIQKHTTHLIHNGVHDCPDHMGYYLFTMRHPVERIQSWFRYEYPYRDTDSLMSIKAPLFIDCEYNTLNRLALDGLQISEGDGAVDHADDESSKQSTSVSTSTVCRRRAWDAIRGATGYARHNKFNYQYFSRIVPKSAQIAVLRSEHLYEDWMSMESILQHNFGQNKTTDSGSSVVAGSTNMGAAVLRYTKFNLSPPIKRSDSELSAAAVTVLCRALCPEIQTYKKILFAAVNLVEHQVQQSLQDIHDTCPNETVLMSVEDCPPPPSF